jgi:hypothetical protein
MFKLPPTHQDPDRIKKIKGTVALVVGLSIPALLALAYLPHGWAIVLGGGIGIWWTMTRAARRARR